MLVAIRQFFRKRSQARGAALVETALALIFLNSIFFVAYQTALIGFAQLTMDAGVDTQARFSYYTLTNNPNALQTALGQIFPYLAQYSKLQPAATLDGGTINTENIDYQFNTPGARTGGFSFVVPLPQVADAYTNKDVLHFGNSAITLNAFAVEANIMEICPHLCINGNGQGSETESTAINYFTQGENTPPYFMSFNFSRFCGADKSQDLSVAAPEWDSCQSLNPALLSNTSTDLRALGTAAHLDMSNDLYTQTGTYLSPAYNGTAAPPDQNQAGPFYQLECHLQFYELIDNLAVQQTPTITAGQNTFNPKWLAPGMPGYYIYNDGPGHTTAGWDVDNLGGSTHYAEDPANALSPWYGCSQISTWTN